MKLNFLLLFVGLCDCASVLAQEVQLPTGSVQARSREDEKQDYLTPEEFEPGSYEVASVVKVEKDESKWPRKNIPATNLRDAEMHINADGSFRFEPRPGKLVLALDGACGKSTEIAEKFELVGPEGFFDSRFSAFAKSYDTHVPDHLLWSVMIDKIRRQKDGNYSGTIIWYRQSVMDMTQVIAITHTVVLSRSEVQLEP